MIIIRRYRCVHIIINKVHTYCMYIDTEVYSTVTVQSVVEVPIGSRRYYRYTGYIHVLGARLLGTTQCKLYFGHEIQSCVRR